MAVAHANSGIVKKDLQVYYNANYGRSFAGEPTVNYASYNIASNWTFFANTLVEVANISVPSIYSPDGDTPAYRMYQNSTASAQYLIYCAAPNAINDTVLLSGSYWTFSVYAKLAPNSGLSNGSGNTGNYLTFHKHGQQVATFNLSTGTFVSGLAASYSIVNVGNGWYRCSASFITSNTTGNFYISNYDGVGAVTGIVGKDIYLWRPQLERKSYPTPWVSSFNDPVNKIPIRPEKFINYLKDLGTSGAGSSADNAVDFPLQGTTGFVRLGYGQTFGDYTIQPNDVVYRYYSITNACHYHGNRFTIKTGEYGCFSFEYYIDPAATNVAAVTAFISNVEVVSGSSIGNSVSIPNALKGVWQKIVFFTGVAATNTVVQAFLYPGGCNPSRLMDSGYILIKNPTFTCTSARSANNFTNSLDKYTSNMTLVSQTNFGEMTFTKSGATSWSNARIYSSEGYTGSVYVSFIPKQTNLAGMIALNSDPASGIAYGNLDYAWYTDSSGIAYIFESGTSVLTSGAYTAADTFEIIFDGKYIKYYKNGSLARSVERLSSAALFLDSSFYTDGFAVTNLFFGQYTPDTPSSGAGLLDLSGNNINTNLLNASYNNNGFYLLGSSSNTINFEVPSSFIYSAAGKTVLMWVRHNSTSYTCYCGLGNPATAQSFNLRSAAASVERLGFMGYGADYDPGVGPQINDNVWHLIGATFDAYGAGNLKLYVDGLNIASTTATLSTTPSVGYIGRSTHSSGNEGFLTGYVGQFMLYNRALTEAEVLQIFNSQRKTYGI